MGNVAVKKQKYIITTFNILINIFFVFGNKILIQFSKKYLYEELGMREILNIFIECNILLTEVYKKLTIYKSNINTIYDSELYYLSISLNIGELINKFRNAIIVYNTIYTDLIIQIPIVKPPKIYKYDNTMIRYAKEELSKILLKQYNIVYL
jgi:hypothetical protein